MFSESPSSTALSNESFNDLKDEVESMKEQIQYLEKMLRDVTSHLNLQQRPFIGIPPRHIGSVNANSGHMYSTEAMNAAGVMMGIPVDMSSPPESKKRQRLHSNVDVVPIFAPAMLSNVASYSDCSHGPTSQPTKSAAQVVVSDMASYNTHSNEEELAWDELETIFEESDITMVATSAAPEDETKQEFDDEADYEVSDAIRGPLLRGMSNSSTEMITSDFDYSVESFDALTHPDMLVVPASIIVNDQSIQQWEWAAVGQILNAPTSEGLQVDQLADALLTSTLENDTDSTALETTHKSNEYINGEANVDQVRPYVPSHSISAIVDIVMQLPVPLQERFTDRFSTVLGERLADHLARQAEEVHLAMVEASYGGVYYNSLDKKDGEVMDVSHYAQVVTTSLSSVPTTVASTILDNSSVAGINEVVAPVAADCSHAIATRTFSGQDPSIHALAQVIGTTASQLGMPTSFVEYTLSALPPQNHSSPHALDSHAVASSAVSSSEVAPLEINEPGTGSGTISTVVTAESSQCLQCRATALQTLYQPQQPAIAYPLAAAALGALFVKWGDACARNVP